MDRFDGIRINPGEIFPDWTKPRKVTWHGVDVAGNQDSSGESRQGQHAWIESSIGYYSLCQAVVHRGFPAAQTATDLGIEIGVRQKPDCQALSARTSRCPRSKRSIMSCGRGLAWRNSSYFLSCSRR